MALSEEFLYIFLHIPRCAGTTLLYHIENNFKKEEIIGYYSHDKDPIKTLRKRITSLSDEQKEKVKVIYGHWVPYGFHEFFEKKPRYFTFMRNPVDQTISSYNFFVTQYHYELQRKNLTMNYKNCLLIKGKVPFFVEWLERKYDDIKPTISIAKLLRQYKYLADEGSLGESVEKLMSKFYFVGITETYDKDALFMYDKLGINRFYANQNISQKHFLLKNNKKTEKLILEKNKLDMEIYRQAINKNRKLRKSRDYHEIVRYMRKKRALILPFTQGWLSLVQGAYRVINMFNGIRKK